MSRNFKNFQALLCSGLLAYAFVVAKPTSAQQLIAPPKIAPDSVSSMKTMLVQLWEPGQVNRAQVDALFDQLSTKTPELTLAYVANRLHDARRRDALRALETATVENPEFLDGWLLKAHLDVLVEQFEAGLVALRSAKRAFGEATATQSQRTVFYRRTGELIGFMQGPVSTRVDPMLLNSTIDQLILGAADQDLATFQAAAESIRNQFSENAKSSQDRLAAELQKQAAEDAQLQTTLANQNQNLMQSEQALRNQLSQLNTEFAQQESQLTSQLSPIQSSMLGLENQIQSLQLNLQFFYSDLAHAQNQRVVCHFTVRAILDQINRAEFALFGLQSNYQSYFAQFQSVQSQIQATRNRYQGQINDLQRELKRISGTVARNNNKLGKIAGGPKVSSGKKAIEANRITSIGRYLKLPEELIRQELIDQLNSL